MQYLEKNKDITNLSNYKTPAKVDYFFELQKKVDIDKIFEVCTWAKQKNLPILFVSGGTNMLFAFDQYKWVVIQNSLKWWTYSNDTKILETYGSESIWNIAECLEKDYRQDLWHRFIGLPGSIAGAVYGNAGCFGLETENNFSYCRLLNLENGQANINVKECVEIKRIKDAIWTKNLIVKKSTPKA